MSGEELRGRQWQRAQLAAQLLDTGRLQKIADEECDALGWAAKYRDQGMIPLAEDREARVRDLGLERMRMIDDALFAAEMVLMRSEG